LESNPFELKARPTVAADESRADLNFNNLIDCHQFNARSKIKDHQSIIKTE